jgi:hypothetical protein
MDVRIEGLQVPRADDTAAAVGAAFIASAVS